MTIERTSSMMRESFAEPPVQRNKPTIKTDPRRVRRVRTCLKGQLVFGRTAVATDCTICDISPAGARLRVGRTAVIPESAYLILFRNWAAFESVVRWRRKDGTLGVKFLTMHDLKSPNSDEMKVLRRYCIEGTPGGSPVPLCGRSADQVAS